MNKNEAFLDIPVRDWMWIAALSFWRAGIAGRLGLGVDEAHYALYGARPALSYFDHPPLVGWIQAIFRALLGQTELAARLPAIACGVVTTALVYRLALRAAGGGRWAARAAALAANASFLMAALWLMFLPDSVLAPLALWLVDIGARLVERDRRRDWVELGICLGLCGLAKYTSVLFLLPLLAFAAHERALSRIKPLRALGAAAIALALISPVLLWNALNDWISFKYQTGHVLGAALSFSKFGLFLAGQIGGYSPFLIAAAAMGWWLARKRYARAAQPAAGAASGGLRLRLALWLGLTTLLFFAYASLHDEVLLHWTLVAWTLLLPLGLALLIAQGWTRTGWSLLATTGAITLVLMAELAGQFIPWFQDWQSPYADLTGWREVRRDVSRLQIMEPKHEFSIAVPNWTLGSRANYYLSDLAPVYVLDNRFDQFDLWEGGPPQTKDLLVVSWRGFELGAGERARCASVDQISKRTFVSHGHPVNQVTLSWCRGYKAPPEASGP